MLFLQPAALTKGADYVRTVHHVSVAGATLDDLLRPSFWSHVAGKLRVHDLIDVIDDAGAFDVTMRVVEVGQGFAKMRPLRLWRDEAEPEKPAADVPIDQEFEPVPGLKVKWRGPRAKWSVVRASDKSENGVLKAGCATKAEAEAWAIEHAEIA